MSDRRPRRRLPYRTWHAALRTPLVLLAGLALTSSCIERYVQDVDDQGNQESHACITNKPVPIPQGTYRDAGIVLDYQRLVPEPDPRVGLDVRYTSQVITTPERLEQAYYDAQHGNRRAALFVCIAEVGIRGYGRQLARALASKECATVIPCTSGFENLKLSKTTYSGRRLRGLLAQAFEKQARWEKLTNEVILNGLAIFAAGKVALGVIQATRAPAIANRALPHGSTGKTGSMASSRGNAWQSTPREGSVWSKPPGHANTAGRSSSKAVGSPLEAPGRWVNVSESMSARAAAYQTRITGRTGQSYVVNGVRFDGFKNGVLLEAKGPGYAKFVKNGRFRAWFTGSDGFLAQARRQLAAARGTPVQWHFAEETAANATRALFRGNGISGIQVVVTP
ncbi:MAG: restriction endonuclease fold toxin 5 domain-containing protein [Proteobacteria bacterium]|nr:restriction endonuclease fold toxin 5 domain-containing protein [Pseudomonadota bacterium]